MKKSCLIISLLVLCIFSIKASAAVEPMLFVKKNANGTETLLRHVPKAVGKTTTRLVDHVKTAKMLNMRFLLPSKDQAGLNQFLADIYNKKSPNYHKFLTPQQFNQRFGASVTDIAAVTKYLAGSGLRVTGQSANGMVIKASGPVSAVEKTFKVSINNYKTSEGVVFFAPNTDPTIGIQAAGRIRSIAGLDNAVKFKPHYRRISTSLSQSNKSGFTGSLSSAASPSFSGPSGGLAPADFRAAYNFDAIPSTGKGQILGLFQLDGYKTSDITVYKNRFNLNVPLQNIYTNGFDGSAGTDTGEVVLDIDLAMAAAPGLSRILVYETQNTLPSWIDQWQKIAEDNVASTVSCSWGGAESDHLLSYDHSVFQQMAAQGQSVFVASGDAGAYGHCENGTVPPECADSTLAVDDPASDPYVTGVGISKITVNSNGSYSSETASLYGGGGISDYNSIPTPQQGLTLDGASLVSTTMRNVPDVSLTSDPNTPFSIYISDPTNGTGWYLVWGSSAASPIWAGYAARVNQGRQEAGLPAIGWLNAAIYDIAKGPNYETDFHDITTGTNSHYPAKPGYDAATGLGSMNGPNLYQDLITPSVPPQPTGLQVKMSNDQVALDWVSVSGAASYNVKQATVSGGPYTTISNSGEVTTNHFTDTTTSLSNTYYYVVSAVNATGESIDSAEVSINTESSAVTPPTNLGASAIGIRIGKRLTYNGIKVFWNQSSSGSITQNKIYRAVNSGAYGLYATVNASTSFTDSQTTRGYIYRYYVTAVGSAATESSASNTTSVSIP